LIHTESFFFKIIDEETLSQKERNKRKEPYAWKGIQTLDKGGLGVLEKDGECLHENL
jgi:hypothetical protein